MRTLALCTALLAAAPIAAETLVAARTIRPKEVLSPEDVALAPGTIAGALSDPAAAVGLEARVALYAGRPVHAGDLAPPAVIERNAMVRLKYAENGLSIWTEGRALDRAAPGERLRVMNLSSRAIVAGLVGESGVVHISTSQP